MADDGLLMNFSLEGSALDAVPVFKGGRWKDRLAAKKVARRRQEKVPAPSRPSGSVLSESQSNTHYLSNDSYLTNQPTKRRRLGKGFNVVSEDSGTALPRHNSAGKIHEHIREKPQQVISSLFSFNPKSRFIAVDIQEETGPTQPTNAPLLDDLATFTDLGLSPTLATHLLKKMDLKAPTAIQKAAIKQLIMEDSDAFIQAETGSGKTLAYLLPIVQRIMRLSDHKEEQQINHDDKLIHRDSGLFAIILGPTRELCKQISIVLENLLRCAHWIVAGTVLGGEKRKSEKARLRKGLNILVATPGRLADHLQNTEALDVCNVRWLVLDEGDRLMDLGFEAEIQGIVSKLSEKSQISTRGQNSRQGLPDKRTTVLCSATMKMNVQRLGEISLKDAVHIMADVSEQCSSAPKTRDTNSVMQAFSAPAQLKQAYAVVPAKLRLVTLAGVLKRAFARRVSVMKVIVFISCADSVDFHFAAFSKSPEKTPNDSIIGEDSNSHTSHDNSQADTVAPAFTFSNDGNQVTLHKLHGSLPQNVRTATLASFRRSQDPAVLVCTDVASRGLDLPNVDIVIEFDPPFSREDHLHRIGRTARAGRDGRSLIFLLPGEEEQYLDLLKETLRDGVGGIKRTDANELLHKGFGSIKDSKEHDWEGRATEWQLDVERWALETPKHLDLARRAYRSHIRAYCTHVAAERKIFNIKTLHLGHLAKSFALRDKPTSINVPGLRLQDSSIKVNTIGRGLAKGHAKKNQSNNLKQASHETPIMDVQEAARKMRTKVRQQQMSGASEFNLG